MADENDSNNPRKNVPTAKAAQHYKVDRKTMLAWTHRGCPVKRAGRVNRFDLDAVDGWLESNGRAVPTTTTEVANAAHQ